MGEQVVSEREQFGIGFAGECGLGEFEDLGVVLFGCHPSQRDQNRTGQFAESEIHAA